MLQWYNLVNGAITMSVAQYLIALYQTAHGNSD